jgi:hypothetical protein
VKVKRAHIDDFIGGWFIGEFEPTIHKTNAFEVCCKRFSAGATEPIHYQIHATEYTLVISGRCRIGDVELGPGEILEIGPNVAADFEALDDVVVVAIKTPSLPNDKVVGNPS